MTDATTLTAFAGDALLASGALAEVLTAARAALDRDPGVRLSFFDDETGRPLDFDLRGAAGEVVERALGGPARPGRPRLGVVGREVSLLPRHWEWLEQQPNGISAALRRLVDEARRREPGRQRARALRDAASRFMTAMAGDRPGYEEALRALYAGEATRFERLVRGWPADVRRHALRYAREAARLEAQDGEGGGAR